MTSTLNARLNTPLSLTLPLIAAMAMAGAPGMAMAQASQSDSDSRLVLSGSDVVNLKISGQINRAVMVADDGDDVTLLNVDNNNSSSRLSFVAETKKWGELMAGAAYETEFRLNNSASMSQDDSKDNDTSAFRNRRVEVYFNHDRYGRLWLGQGWTATEGVAENDLSGTTIASYSNTGGMGGGILFRDKDSGLLTGTDLGDVVSNLDGFGRNTRVRYDTPMFGGFQFRTSVVNDGAVDAGLWYRGNTDRLQIAAGLGWGNTNELSESPVWDDQLSGSVSVLDESGFNVSFAAGVADARESGRDDLTFHYTKLGYQALYFPRLGRTAFSTDWMRTNNKDQNDDTVDVIGLQAVQSINPIGTDAYASLRHVSLDRDGVSYEDQLVLMVGARIRF